MLSIITAVIGLLGGFFPELLKYFKAKQDNKQELEVLKLQAQMQAQTHTENMEEINTKADISESEALYKSAEIQITGVKWVDALIEVVNSLVRPVITYSFLGFYAAHKFEYTSKPFDEFDQSTLTLVLGYWFGQRAAKWAFGKK
jgi:hypothetical protein